MSAIDYPAAVYDAVIAPTSLEQLSWVQDVLESMEAPYVRSGSKLVTFLAAARRLASVCPEELPLSILTTGPKKHLRMVPVEAPKPQQTGPVIPPRPLIPRSHTVKRAEKKPARPRLRMIQGQAQPKAQTQLSLFGTPAASDRSSPVGTSDTP